MALLVGGGFIMPKTMLQLPNFKPYKQSGNMILSCTKSPTRPPGSSGSPPQINPRDLASSKKEKQLDNRSKTTSENDGSTKKSKSSENDGSTKKSKSSG